jgi:hypothetical protein
VTQRKAACPGHEQSARGDWQECSRATKGRTSEQMEHGPHRHSQRPPRGARRMAVRPAWMLTTRPASTWPPVRPVWTCRKHSAHPEGQARETGSDSVATTGPTNATTQSHQRRHHRAHQRHHSEPPAAPPRATTRPPNATTQSHQRRHHAPPLGPPTPPLRATSGATGPRLLIGPAR